MYSERRPHWCTVPLSVPPGFHRLRWEERQLWRLARRDVPISSVEVVLRESGGTSAAWRALVALGARLSVLPLLARAIEAHPALAAVIPDDGVAAVRLATWSARARGAAYRHALAPVLDAWAAAGIRPVFLKGMALAHTLYPQGARWLHDADIWVPPAQFERAEHALHGAGFVRMTRPGLDPDEARRAFHGQVYVRPGRDGHAPIVIDLHDTLFVPGSRYRLDMADVGRVPNILPTGHTVEVMRPEEQFVHLATQIAGDGRLPLQRFADLVALRMTADAETPRIDVTRLEAIAARTNAAPITALAWRWAGMDAMDGGDEQTAAPSSAGAVIGHAFGWLPDRELPMPVARLITLTAVQPGTPQRQALVDEVGQLWARSRTRRDIRAAMLALRLPLLLLATAALLVALSILAPHGARVQEPLVARCWRRRRTPPSP